MNFKIEDTLCFTGHRPNKLNGYEKKDNLNLIEILKEEIENQILENNKKIFISGMALGIDIWAAEIVLELKNKYPQIKLICAIPCKNQSSKWFNKDKVIWEEVSRKCDYLNYISEEEYTPWCMQDRNKWMVDNSNSVIAVWNGTKGGTYNCIKYAEKKEKDILFINPNLFK